MDEIERRQHELHARLPAFQRKVDRAYESIRQAFDLDVHFYLGFSGGVDSTVLLHMLFQHPWQGSIIWGDDGFDFPENLAFLRDTESRYGFHLQRIRCMEPWRDWCDEMSRPDLASDPQALAAWGNPHEWDATWDSLKESVHYGYDGVFLGLLASESRSRSYALRDGWKPLYRVKREHDMWHCSPLARWDKRDVMAYAVSQGIAYNPVYDKLAELSVPLERRRVAPLTCFRVMQYGSASMLKAGWPELFNRLAAIFPRVREYS